MVVAQRNERSLWTEGARQDFTEEAWLTLGHAEQQDVDEQMKKEVTKGTASKSERWELLWQKLHWTSVLFFSDQSRKWDCHHPYSLPYSLKVELCTSLRLPLSFSFLADLTQSTRAQLAFNTTAFLSLPFSWASVSTSTSTPTHCLQGKTKLLSPILNALHNLTLNCVWLCLPA